MKYCQNKQFWDGMAMIVVLIKNKLEHTFFAKVCVGVVKGRVFDWIWEYMKN